MSTISKIPREVSNSEIEKNEVIIHNNLITEVAKGSKHNSDLLKSGGVPTILGEGTRILSHHLKADKELSKNLVGKDKKMSFAEMGKMYNTIPELTTLISEKEDDLSKKTAQLMLTKKVAQLDSIYNAQETQKEETSKNTLDDILGKVSIKKYQKGGKVPITYGNLGTSSLFNPYTRLRTDPIYTESQLFTDEPMVKQNLFTQKLFNDPRVGSYQRKEIGWDDKQGYLQDPLSKAVRRETVQHLFDDAALPNWKHIDVYDEKGNPIVQGGKKLVSTLPEGDFTFNMRKNALGETVPSYVDNDNVRYQVPMYKKEGYDATPDIPQSNQPINPIANLPLKPLTPLEIPKTPITSNPSVPQDNIPYNPIDKPKGTNWDDPYKLNALRDIVDLSTLEVRPPEYNYQPQNIAYQRYLPQNTLVAERQYNLMKTQIENSNLPEGVKIAMLSDISSKLQDDSSKIALQNYQIDNQNDNNNISLYNQITNQNRSERINYDDKNAELQDRTLFNYGQEKLRLQDQLINNYGKHKQNNLMLNLANQMGTNYMFNGSEIVYVPNRGSQMTSDPMQQYQQSQIQQLLKDLNAATSSVDKKNIADAIKSLQGK